VQYFFDWGDGTYSGWLAAGVTSASHQWTAAGVYTVTARARCGADWLMLSSPSGGLSVSIQGR